jgi:hypothetical protein
MGVIASQKRKGFHFFDCHFEFDLRSKPGWEGHGSSPFGVARGSAAVVTGPEPS